MDSRIREAIELIAETLDLHQLIIEKIISKQKEYERVFRLLAQEINKNRVAFNHDIIERIDNR